MNLSNLKIGTRLYAGFGLVVLIFAALLSISYVNFAKLGNANALNIHTYQVMLEVEKILENLVSIETGQRGFALTGEDASLEPMEKGLEGFKLHFAKAKALTSDNPAQQARLDKLEEQQSRWLAVAIDPVVALRRDVNSGSAQMDSVVTMVQTGKGKQGMDAMRALMAEVSGAESLLLEQRAKDAAALQSITSMTMIGGGIAAAVIAMLLGIWLANNITRPLAVAVGLAKRVAEGDLTANIEARSKDEAGQLLQALKHMNSNLVKIVGEVRSGTETMTTASSQITAGNFDLSSRTEQQASSLEETASSMEELTSTVKQNADNARQANQLAITASDVAVKGGAVVSQVVSTMGSINASATKIVDIISVIDGIAFQTNILALNAAVEAARAGEQGRGFAVVATEVRNLAQRSAAAAKEIKTLIGDSVEKVNIGSKLVGEAGATMNEVVVSVKRVTDIMGEIMSASQEQSAGIDQVNQAIAQMDQVTQQNAALVEEAAAAAESMQDQAGNLARVVSVFKLGVHEQTAAQPALARQPAQSRSLPAIPRRKAVVAPQSPLSIKRPAAAKSDEWEEF